MSELMLNQIQHMLHNVSDAVQTMGDSSTHNIDVIMGALDDMAANVMATQAVVATMLKKYPVELAEVEAWLKQDIQNPEGIPATTLAVTRYLVTGKSE